MPKLEEKENMTMESTKYTEYAEYAAIKSRFDDEVNALRERAESRDKELQDTYKKLQERLKNHVYVVRSVFNKVWGGANAYSTLPEIAVKTAGQWEWALNFDWKVVGLDEDNIIVEWEDGRPRVNGKRIPGRTKVSLSILSMSDRQVAFLARTAAWRGKASITYQAELQAKRDKKHIRGQMRALEKKRIEIEKELDAAIKKGAHQSDYLNGRASRIIEVRRKTKDTKKQQATMRQDAAQAHAEQKMEEGK